ncbi:TlpA family protein disulfide reductase [Asanoa iriomotensis]|uniref:Thioredoxin domain-containing protein n=1 Tax=Asanoa iriomotensis TaxID=234613 RepID=A0ABQ4C2G4_9ACTN|nr:hypothetical protein [Asanoa iriomotensis]GIF56485.1 hypothetical protein Air01nite_25800 [Asanoa iriomotensis]
MAVAVAVLGLFCLANLLLTVGVVRRLRDHSAMLELVGGPEVISPVGSAVDEYAAVAIDGASVRRDLLVGLTLVGFFSPTCGPCHERLPLFVTRARLMPAERVLAVVVGQGDDDSDGTREIVGRLTEVATVVVEPPNGVLAQAFGVRGFPAFALVDASGEVVGAGTDPATLPVAVAW